MRFFTLIFLLFLPLATIANDEDVPLEVLHTQKYLRSSSPPTSSPSATIPALPKASLPTPAIRNYVKSGPLPNLTMPQRSNYSFAPGSLKENIIHLAKQLGWPTVVWQLPYDYQWVGSTHFHKTNIKAILQSVLQNFPLQAVFYEGNHVLVIEPRNIS